MLPTWLLHIKNGFKAVKPVQHIWKYLKPVERQYDGP
uniref:Uncharacterized protein n=1 Tax=Anguilla anguilla TaxID=7936 RepID=A0A0E9QCY9_ANGAN